MIGAIGENQRPTAACGLARLTPALRYGVPSRRG